MRDRTDESGSAGIGGMPALCVIQRCRKCRQSGWRGSRTVAETGSGFGACGLRMRRRPASCGSRLALWELISFFDQNREKSEENVPPIAW